MLEYPEVMTMAKQMREHLAGSRVVAVRPPTKPHKFCWFQGDPADYHCALAGSGIVTAEGFGIYVELVFDNGCRLCFNDGVRTRLLEREKVPSQYQLSMELADGRTLVFTVAMYGGIVLHRGEYENEYYQKSREGISPLSQEFGAYFRTLLAESKPNLSLKALLATGQRIPGLGNGVLQDILFAARLHPKRKCGALLEQEADRLLRCIPQVLGEMTAGGGRNTEKDLWDRPGQYLVKMGKGALTSGCPCCGGSVVKETYLGGAVYFCPDCQSLEKPLTAPQTEEAGKPNAQHQGN